jgi:hypothetical protein
MPPRRRPPVPCAHPKPGVGGGVQDACRARRRGDGAGRGGDGSCWAGRRLSRTRHIGSPRVLTRLCALPRSAALAAQLTGVGRAWTIAAHERALAAPRRRTPYLSTAWKRGERAVWEPVNLVSTRGDDHCELPTRLRVATDLCCRLRSAAREPAVPRWGGSSLRSQLPPPERPRARAGMGAGGTPRERALFRLAGEARCTSPQVVRVVRVIQVVRVVRVVAVSCLQRAGERASARAGCAGKRVPVRAREDL